MKGLYDCEKERSAMQDVEMARDLINIASILDFVILMTWSALQTKIYMNQLFPQRIPTQDVLFEFLKLANITFCLGLLDAVKCATLGTFFCLD